MPLTESPGLSLASVRCSAQHPGKNLPEDGSWRNAPREKCFLFVLFLALDTNFWMKRKDVSTKADDPSLGDGIAFFSQVDAYMKHLKDHWDMEQEVRAFLLFFTPSLTK
jgi:hypothetical protein